MTINNYYVKINYFIKINVAKIFNVIYKNFFSM